MLIKVIFFDLGNVIVFVNHMEICERIAGRDCSSLDIYRYVFLGGIEAELDKGLVSPFDFFTKIKKRFDLDLNFKDFINIWSSELIPNKEIFPLIMRLKPYYRLCLLSNTNQIHFEQIQRNISILAEFEAFFLSFQMGVRKPDPSIFQMALDYLKVMPHECVYIDDIDDFVESARRLGINGIVFRDVSDLKETLVGLGINLLEK